MKTNYNKFPHRLGSFPIEVAETFSYQYIPISLAGSSEIVVEKRLQIFDKLIGRACCDFVGKFGLDSFVKHYIYLTAKHQYQRGGQGFGREGWHSDGFGSPDISYIWSNKQPTIFNSGDFFLSDDDKLSMTEMEEQAKPENNYSFINNSLIRMDQFSIHRVGDYEEGYRAFIKICFSLDKYNLIGNSINHELDCGFEYVARSKERNIPQQK